MKTFTKAERLTSKKIITELYNKGKVIRSIPVKVLWLDVALPVNVPVQALITVPKLNFKRANTRNRIKRKMREAYRKNKQELADFMHKANKQCALMLIYAGKKEEEYAMIEKKIIVTLQNVIKSQ